VRAKQHDTLFPAMIKSWRKWWGNERLPFYFVQLASFRAREVQPSEGGLAAAAGVPVGKRWPSTTPAWRWPSTSARRWRSIRTTSRTWGVASPAGPCGNCYGEKDFEVSGPLYASSAVEGDKIRVCFMHTDGGLKAKDGALKRVRDRGADKNFVWGRKPRILRRMARVVWERTA